MAVGLGLFGLSGYLFVVLTGRTLSDGEANLAISFYFVANVVGAGIFFALEQVTSRSTSSALASGLALRPMFIRVRKAGTGLVAVVVVILLLLAPVLVGTTLHDDWGLFAEVLATPVVAACLSVVRGLLGGMRRFGGYAATLTVEGGARLLLCVLLAIVGTSEAWIYGMAYLASSVVAMLAGLLWLRRGSSEPVPVQAAGAAVHPAVGKGLAALAVANLLAQLLPNLAPLAVTSRLPLDSTVALAFGQAVVIARLPLLAFLPVQTMLLPGLTSAVARGELGVVAHRIRLTLAAVVAFGVVYSVIFLLLGPWVLKTFVNPAFQLDPLIMLLLAASTVVLIGAFAVQPAMVALGRDRTVTLGWAIGSAATLGLVLLPTDPATTAAAAQVVGAALTLLVVMLGLRVGLRQPAERDTNGLDAARGR